MTSSPGAADTGLAAERTVLAWTRTSLGVLANGALLLFRDLHGHFGLLGLAAVGLALAVALYTFVVGIRRQRTLASRPLPSPITPRWEVYLVASAVMSLIVVSVASLDF
ncbi:DUF202 domain-containing protein [Mycobacterium sp. B14F4]|uniref:DUF202 domain-containing protein n=1 Tax=Mycobacterium sp. B14F4 TaxID=3153565 RepID=UPI00325D74F0